MKIRYLHLSDLHFKGDSRKSQAEKFNRDIVSKAGLHFIKNLDAADKIDFIVITGDLAHGGGKKEYGVVMTFCEELLKVLNLGKNRLFLVPGNHDVDRNKVLGSHINRYYNFKTQDEITELIKDPDMFPTIMRKFSGYNSYANKIMGWDAYKNSSAYCYHKSLLLQKDNEKIEINMLGLNSALFAGYDDDDKQKLALGFVQIEKILSGVSSEAAFTMAFFHHPFECFHSEEEVIKNLLMKEADIILTGHLHKTGNMCISNQAGKALIVRAGAFFETRQSKNSFNIVNINAKTGRGDIQFYKYLYEQHLWKIDTDINPEGIGGKFPFKIIMRGMKPSTIGVQKPLIIPKTYSSWIVSQYGLADLGNLKGTGGFAIKLPVIFIPLYAKVPTSLGYDESDIEELIAKHGALVVEGEAGSGKTTLFKHVAYQLATGNPVFEMNNYLPILIFLKEWNDFFCGLNYKDNPIDKILKNYSSLCGNNIELKILKRFCKTKRVVFLLDGLDEIPIESRKIIVNFFANYNINTGNKVMFSGRNHGVDGTARKRFSEKCVKVNALNSKQISKFVEKWFRVKHDKSNDEAKKAAEGMLEQIKVNKVIDRLIENPLMLTTACIIYHDGNVLPDQRAQLYDKFIDNVVRRRLKNPEAVKRFLGDLAFGMHKEKKESIYQIFAEEKLMNIFKNKGQMEDWEYKNYIKESFLEIESKCGLMMSSKGQFAFRHLTYQEFLTAVNIKEKNTDYLAAIKEYWDDERYKEVIKLFIGNLSNSGNREWANKIVENVIKRGKPIKHLILAGEAFKDFKKDLRDEPVLKALRERYWREINGNTTAVEKFQLGKLIGALGDTRDLKRFIKINKNVYFLEGRINDDADGENGFEIDEFEIGKYLINRAWYSEFIDNDGYKEEKYWSTSGLSWRKKDPVVIEPESWSKEGLDCQNFPIVGISFYEAQAFCNWLTQHEQDNYIYRLPKEEEWQAVAAGTEARKYPWGKENPEGRANYKSLGIEGVSTVGLFEKGDTIDKITDMAGNVWEWTQSFEKNTQDDRCITRGGAWSHPKINLICEERHQIGPDTRATFIGFRCVRELKGK